MTSIWRFVLMKSPNYVFVKEGGRASRIAAAAPASWRNANPCIHRAFELVMDDDENNG
jgi:hypothetical protein